MTDYDRFMEFFDGMGVPYGMPNNLGSSLRHGEEPDKSIFSLSVSQAHFCFDRDKNYLGVVSDEMGIFEPRCE